MAGQGLAKKIRDSVAFVTDANLGLGLAFVQELLAAGTRKVYAAARNGRPWAQDGEHARPVAGARGNSRRDYGRFPAAST